MTAHSYLDSLNEMQRSAAVAIEGPLLIIAGAGSGKTRVVTSRIAHMLESGIPQKQILALTFTNKAAREMRSRIVDLSGKKLKSLTVSTFHAFGVTILRKYAGLLGYNSAFTIYDQVDKVSLLKEVLREIGKPGEQIDFYTLTQWISSEKLGRAASAAPDASMNALYIEYNDHLKVYNALDFDDLIALPIKLLTEFPEALEEIRDTYRYVLVDEFQDTSSAQYRIVKTLAEESRNLCVVGDDDQSIYSWRGANYENIITFERDFPERTEIKLEQNYRSSSDILAAANSLIKNNTRRKIKSLWTGKTASSSIELVFPADEHAEGMFITQTIRTQAIRRGIAYNDFGILVRTNNLMDAIEEALMADNIPYRVSGGTSFFQRKEIRDLVGYLKILANPDDDVSLLRIINVPRRGIGKTTIMRLREYAGSRSLSLFSALSAVLEDDPEGLGPRPAESLAEFRDTIEAYRDRMLSGRGMAQTLSDLVGAINYWGYLLIEHQKNDAFAKYKFGNIQRFIDMMDKWEKNPDTIEPALYDYLTRISLVTRDDLSEDDEKGKVNLMTIHAAKGLEFTVVFVAGTEDGLIPHARALEDDPGNIEEERRLFYVALTRAKEKLFLSSCVKRRVMREIRDSVPSRFIEEIPEDLITQHQDEAPVAADDAEDFFAKMKAQLRPGQ